MAENCGHNVTVEVNKLSELPMAQWGNGRVGM